MGVEGRVLQGLHQERRGKRETRLKKKQEGSVFNLFSNFHQCLFFTGCVPAVGRERRPLCAVQVQGTQRCAPVPSF